ncbi:hypothetical protein Tco_0332239 [Tanacetum coccineum]
MENQIVWESRQEDIRRPVPRLLVFFGPQSNLNKPPRYLYNKDLFFLKHGNTEEKKYALLLHKIHAERFPEVDLEERINRWVRKEFKTFNEDARLTIHHWKDSWHKRVKKVNYRETKLMNSLITFIRSRVIWERVHDFQLGIKKIVKFCDATLEKVLNEVRLKIFQSEPWRKSPLLGELDRDILRAFEREINKRLRHQEKKRRWESFVNGRPILPTMKRL